MRKLRVLDLFAGLGGFSLGLERTGQFETVAFVEREVSCQKVLKAYWANVPIFDDVKTFKGDEIDGPIDVITAGFPCQDISIAGKRAGLEGDQSSLFWEAHRIIRTIQPQWAVLENVPGLLHRWMGDVLGALAQIGYDAEWHCIPASAVGAPHNRDRVWIIAYPQRNEQPRPEPRCRTFRRVGRVEQPVSWDAPWQSALSFFRRMDDGLPRSVHSTDALRNSVVPQIPEMIGYAILAAMQEQEAA